MAQPKSTRPSPRERVAAQREAQRQAAARRRLLIVGAAVAVVVVVVGVIAGVALIGGGSKRKTANPAAPAPSVVSQVVSVPQTVLATVGVGHAAAIPRPINGPTNVGKPTLLYVGAEFCPYCAGERWALVQALSRFGSFSGLATITSSSQEQSPLDSLPTFTFLKASYTSPYLNFQSVETRDVQGNTLQQPTPAQQKLVETYDAPPYVPATDKGAIPFLYFAGKYVSIGGGYDVSVLHGKTAAQVAVALDNPTTAIAQAIDGTANMLTATICATTNNQPVAVCTAPGVQAAAAKLHAGS